MAYLGICLDGHPHAVEGQIYIGQAKPEPSAGWLSAPASERGGRSEGTHAPQVRITPPGGRDDGLLRTSAKTGLRAGLPDRLGADAPGRAAHAGGALAGRARGLRPQDRAALWLFALDRGALGGAL